MNRQSCCRQFRRRGQAGAVLKHKAKANNTQTLVFSFIVHSQRHDITATRYFPGDIHMIVITEFHIISAKANGFAIIEGYCSAYVIFLPKVIAFSIPQ